DEASDDQDEPVNSADAMSFNIGNSSSLKYNGQMYAPIADVNLENSKYSQGRNPSASSEPLFQSSNFGSTLSYSIQVPNGNYTIKTYHIEEYFGYNGIAASAGQRVFDILLENQTVKKDFDMYKENNNRETV